MIIYNRLTKIATIISLSLILIIFIWYNSTAKYKKVTIHTSDNQTIIFEAELAISDQKRTKGLMYRKYLANDKAMLFLYDEEQIINMWMSNTTIPLDMIFINNNNIIMNIKTNAKPNSLSVISSKIKVNKILEINAGLVDKYKIKIGDNIVIED